MYKPSMKYFCCFAAFFLSFSSLSHSAEFRLRLAEDLGTLDWGNGEVNYPIVQQLMEGLTRWGKNGEALPAIAKSWKSFEGGRVYRFWLRKDAKWSNGAPVCSQNFVDAWLRLLAKSTHSPYAHYAFEIEGARAFNQGVSKAEAVKISAPSCELLEVRLIAPRKFFPQLVSHWVFFPIPFKGVEKDFFTPEKIVTNGPYLLSSWKRDQEFILKKNENSFRSSKIDTIRALVIPNDSTALTMYEQKKIDWLKDLPLSEKRGLSSRADFFQAETLVSYHLGFRMRDPRIDKDIRCSLMMAIDQSEIPKFLTGDEKPMFGLSSRSKPRFNLTRAKTLLKDFNGRLQLNAYSKEIHAPLVEWLQNQWKKNLGLRVEIVRNEGKSYWAKLAQDPPQIFLSGITAAYPHSYAIFSEFERNRAGNWGWFESKKYDRLTAQMASVEQPASRLLLEAEKILIDEECAIIPLYFRKTSGLLSKKVKGFEMTPMATYYVDSISYF